MLRVISSLLAIFALVFTPVQAQVTSRRLERAASEPRNWMVYGGSYDEYVASTGHEAPGMRTE